MKRLIILVVLVLLAGIAGIVARSSSRNEIKEFASHKAGDSSQVIRESHELAPGAQVELAALNGSVKIETSDSKTAEILIERTASSEKDLERRPITIQATANSLRIKSEKNNNGFLSRFFGSDVSERVTLKLPRQISLYTKGVNGPVTVGELDGSVEIAGVNGKVEIASANGTASFKGVNGNIVVGLKTISAEGVTLAGVNGNIELQLPADANASLETKGMNGRVTSEIPNVTIEEKTNHGGNYSARIGNGGNSITARGVNGNISLTSSAKAVKATAASTQK